MAKKYPSELNTRTIRINVGDYLLLTEISRRGDITMAEALHLALERQDSVTRISPAQIPMPVLEVTPKTATAINGYKAVAFRVRPQPALLINGTKPSAFAIKPKGVRHD